MKHIISYVTAALVGLVDHIMAAPVADQAVARNADAEPKLRLPAPNEANYKRDANPGPEPVPEAIVEVRDVDTE